VNLDTAEQMDKIVIKSGESFVRARRNVAFDCVEVDRVVNHLVKVRFTATITQNCYYKVEQKTWFIACRQSAAGSKL